MRSAGADRNTATPSLGSAASNRSRRAANADGSAAAATHLPDIHLIKPIFWDGRLVAYGAVDRAPGPAYLGVANLVAFIVSAGVSDDETLYFWPLLILALGLGVLFIGGGWLLERTRRRLLARLPEHRP